LSDIHDLRSALDALIRAGHAVTTIDAPLGPYVALIEDYLDAYRTPTNSWMTADQPLRLYRQPTTGKFPVLMGVFGSRERTRFFLDPQARDPGLSNAALLYRAIANPLPPVKRAAAPPRIVIERPDVNALLPALTCSVGDPGPTVTLGLVYARDEATGAANCSVHRITLKPNSIVVGINPSGHLQQMIDAHVARGERLPVSVNIGLDPVIYIAAALSRPAVEYGDDELAIAGAVRGTPVELAPGFVNGGWFIDHAEIVIEGSFGTERESESDRATPETEEGLSMPEYLGYYSPCGDATTLRVAALTHRPDAIYQAVTGPGREQSELLGAGQEAAVFRVLREQGYGDLVREIAASPAGGGHLLTVLQVAKQSAADDARAKAMAALVLESVSPSKMVVLVDQDVNPFCGDEVLWAMATRFRAEMDIALTSELRGTPLDPSQSSAYAPGGRNGYTVKSVLDCTMPFALRPRFRRAFSLT
jgi:4-hydroxy-3-polyprenylbenzoate decarboxylase